MSFFKPEDISKYTIQKDEDWYDVGSAPSYMPPEDTSTSTKKESWQVTKGLKAGADKVQGMGYGLVAAFADALRADSLKEWGLSGYEANMQEAEENSGNVRGFTDIEGFGDAVDWALYTAGEQGPMLAASLASGGIGAMAAKKLATGAAEKIIAAEVAKGVPLDVAKKTAATHLTKAASAGSLAGAYGSSAGMETGSIYGETQEIEGENKAGNAFAHGAVAGLLDALPQMAILRRLGVGREASEQITESVGKFVGKQMLAEGSTEGLQTIVEQHAKYWLDQNQGMFQPHHWKEIIDASAAGAFMGGLSAGVAAPFRQKPENPMDTIKNAQDESREAGGDALDQAQAGAQALHKTQQDTVREFDPFAIHQAQAFNQQFTGNQAFNAPAVPGKRTLRDLQQERQLSKSQYPDLPPIEGEFLGRQDGIGQDRDQLEAPFIDGRLADVEIENQKRLNKPYMALADGRFIDNQGNIIDRVPGDQVAEADSPLKTRVDDRQRYKALPAPDSNKNVANVKVTGGKQEALSDERTESGESMDVRRKIGRVNLDELSLSNDVPQFKSGANKDGIVEQLQGKYDETGMAPVQVWVRKNGRKEILTGRHRTDLARRSGQKDIPAQLHYEADGFTADHGKALDAILNIRDNQGSVKDYVEFIRSAGITEGQAKELGIASRQLGRRAYTIAKSGSDSLVTALRNDQITEAAAEAIAGVAPNSEPYQAVGLKALQEGKTQTVAVNMIRAAQSMKSTPDMSQDGDLFGFDDSAMKQAEAMAKIASSKQRQLKERVAAVKGAAKNPKLAKQEGVDVKDPESLKKRIAELTAEAERYEEWHKHSDLLQEIRSAVSGEDFQLETQTEESLAQQEAEATKVSQAEAKTKADEEARIDADNEVDMFTLSGSDSVADVAMANGQSDIFADSQETVPESKIKQNDTTDGVSNGPEEAEQKPKSDQATPKSDQAKNIEVSESSVDTYNHWTKNFDSIPASGWRLFEDEMGVSLYRKFKKKNEAGGGYTYAEHATGFDSVDEAKEWASEWYKNTSNKSEFTGSSQVKNTRWEGSDQATAESDQATDQDSPLFIEDISDKAILIKGDTKTHKDRIKAAGGKWHSRQKGWMFLKSKESYVMEKLSDLLGRDKVSTEESDKIIAEPEQDTLSISNGESQEQKGDLGEQLAAMSDDDLSDLIDEIANESNAVDNTKPVKKRKVSTTKEGGKRKLAPRKTKAEKLEAAPDGEKERAATEIAKSMGVNVSKAGMNAINGLAELFGGKGTLSSGLTFDEQTYAKAKPHFVAMLRDFQAAGKDLKDLIRAILDNFGVGVKPYIVRFAQDIRNGQLEGSADDNQINTGNSEEQRGGSGEIREDGADGIGEGDKSPGSDGDGRNGSIDGIGSGESDSSERSNTNNPEAPGFSLENIEGIANGTDKQRVDANLAAIRLMKEIQSSGRYATTDEKNVLAKYVGWGGLSFVFDHTTKKKFAQEAHAELKALLTPTEYNNARSSTRTAFYTSKEIVKAMWQGVEAFGLGGSAMNVVEPSVGSGNFIGWQPSAMREKSKWSASELDTVTGNIAKLIYDDANIQVRGFQDTPFKSNVFSLAIGNPPFGSETITDERNPDISGLRIHNYMIAKSAKLLHEDGLMMMVVTHRFLDTLNENHRNLSSVVDFVGAVRLPNTAFKSNAGTEVTTDIVVFRKLKNGEKASNTVWTDVNGNIDGIRINKYFESNPQNILGRLANDGTLRAGKEELTVHPTEEYGDIRSAVSIALKEMAKGYNLALTDEIKDSLAGEVLLSESSLPIGGMMLDADGKIQMRGDDTELGASIVEVTPSTPWTANGELLAELRDKLLNDETAFETVFRENLTNNGGALKSGYTSKPFKAIQAYSKREISKATLERELDSGIASSSLGDKYNKLKDLLAIRNTALSLIRAEKQDLGTIEQFRARLNKQYDAFAKTYGSKNKPASISASLNLLRDDISIESGLDSVDKKGNVKKHKIFSQRMMQPYKKPTKASDIHDAVNYSIREHGKVDIGYIAKLLGVSKLQARESLTKGNRPYLLKDPAIDELVFIDDYLSGNVKRKYHEAKDAGLVVNEKLLKSVLPKDKPVNKIKASVRASWMDAEVFEQFLQDVGIKAKVNVNRQLGTVRIATVNGSSNTEIGAQFKNDYKGIPELFEAAAAGKSLVIYTKDGNGNQVKHEDGTKQVNVLVNKMAQVFNTWASNNSSIMDRIAKNFNERVNTHIERKFNGRLYFTPVGQNPTIEMRKTQLDGALRMVQSKNVLLDHTVGAGKTFTSISGIMQRKRLGLSKKPMVVVPNHIIGAFTADFYELYPGANILTATEKQMKPAHRKQFFSRIATGDYDAVIIGHSHLRYLPNSLDSFAAVVNEKISELRAALEEAKSQAKESGRRGSSTKQIEDSISSMVDKIEKKKKAIESSHDAIGFDFSDLGVDYLVVDEAHEFKNLTYSTSSDRVVGMNDPKGSEKALDLLTKTRVVQGLDNGGVTFMTGTPISNSLVEVYTMMYYLGYDVLKDGSISHYDAFAGSFLNTETALEYTPTGSVKERVVLKGLSNMQELSVKYRQFADVITRADMVNIFAEDTAEKNEKNKTNDSTAFPIPKVKGGQRRLDLAPATETQREYNDYLIARMSAIEAIKGRQERKEYASIDNPLWVLSDARKASLDIRLVDPASRRDPTGKVARAAKNIKRIYDQWQNDKGAQLVFSDMGTPAKYAKGSVKKELKALASMAMSDAAATKLVNERIAFYDEDAYSKVLQDIVSRIEKAQQSGDIDASQEEALQDMISSLESSVLTADTGFSVYDDLKASLMEAGIPENEIAFIHDYDSVDKKKALFDQVNAGDVRVLIGSSAKMGAGTNAQKRLVALHHMDAPWRPSDMEQREGRIIRQGNDLYTRDPEGFEVEIVAYATQGSSDPVMWQILERKAAAIEQFRSGGLDEYVDDEGGDADSYAEFKASSTGNPIYKHKLQSDARLVEAQTDYYAASSSRSGAERVIENHDEYLARLYARKEAADKFSVTEFDMQSLDAAVSEQNKKFEKELSAFETAFESYEALSDEAKKGAKKPVRPIRPKIHAITHDYTKLLNERVVVPAMEAINAKVNSWSGSIALGENSSLEVDVSRNAFYSDKDKTVYDIEITYLHGRTPIYSYEKPAMATFIGSEDLLNKLNPLVAERAKSSVISETLQAIEAEKNAYAEAKKVVSKSASKEKDRLEEERSFNDWLAVEVEVADAKEDQRRSTQANKYIDRERKRNVKSSGKSKREDSIELMFEGETYKTLGMKVKNGNLFYDVYPSRNINSGEYVHVYAEKDKQANIEVKGVRHKPDGVELQDISFLESSTLFSINAKITAARKGAAITSAKADEVIDRITASWNKGRSNIEVVDTFDELPLAITNQAEKYGAKKEEIPGVFHFGKIYIVRENLKSESDLEETLFHEGYGHYGIRELMGKETGRELMRLFYAIGGSRGFNKIAKENGIDLRPYAQGLAQYPREAKIQVMMDEMLAHLAQSNKPGIKRAFKELIGRIRQFLRDHGFLKTANVTTSELLLVLKNARLAVEGKDTKSYSNSNEVRFSRGGNDGRNTRTNNQTDFSESGDQAEKAERRRLRQLSQKRFRDDAEREFGEPVQNPRSTKPGYYQVTRAGNREVSGSHFTLDAAGAVSGTPDSAIGVWAASKESSASTYGDVLRDYIFHYKNPIAFHADVWNEVKPTTIEEAVKMKEQLIEDGFDGVIITGHAQYHHHIALTPESVVKASEKRLSENFVDYTDIPLMDVDDSGPMFSIRNTQTDEQLEKFGLGAKKKHKLSEAINKKVAQENEDSFWSMFKHRSYEGMFDGLIGIDRAEKAVGVTDARDSGYIGARLATGVADVMHAILHYGAPKWKDGVLQYKEGTQGLLDILGKAGADLHNFLAWVGAHRAEELMAQGKENNLTQADIDDLKGRAKGKEALFKEIHREYKKLNEAMLDMAEGAGLINADARAEWQSDWYIPFYREIEDDHGNVSLLAPRTSKGLSHQTSGIKQLKGGEQATSDLLENILANWMKLADASMKNSALVKTVDNLKDTAYMEEIQGENTVDYVGRKSDKNVIRIQRDGRSEFYKVHDPALLRAVTHLSHPGFHDPISKVGRYMKRLLTTGITSSPDFILRNFIRDAAHAWAINPDGFKFGVDSIKGLKDALRQDPDYRELMFAGASFQGGYVHGTDPEASAQIIRRALQKKGLSRHAIHAYESSLLDTRDKAFDALKQGWQKYRELGDKVENANRLATYKAARKNGKDILQAAFESKDLMDYSLRGNFAMMQYMIDLVPFMNARLQGMSKLVRAGKENPKRVLVEAGFKLALFSFALAMLNDDDERYQELPDWDKDANWHFWLGDEHYRLPKPFEIGIVFGTIPERLTHTLTGTQDSEKLLWSIKHNLWETMAINPTPQFAMPIIESVANRKFFFDQPIEGMSDEGKIDSARYNENTSMTMRVLGEWTGYSPKKLEHLLNGYLGTMGMYALGIADMFADYATGRADKPEWRLEDLPVVKALYRGETNRSTQYSTDVYDRWSEIDQVFRTINAFKKEGRTEEAEELRTDNLEKLRYRRQLGKAREALGDIRKDMDKIMRNRLMSPEAKREKIDALTEKRNSISKKYAELTEEAF